MPRRRWEALGRRPAPLRQGDLKPIEERRVTALGVTVVDLTLLRTGRGDDCLMPGQLEVRWADADGWAVRAEKPREPFPIAPLQTAALPLSQAAPGTFDPDECTPRSGASRSSCGASPGARPWGWGPTSASAPSRRPSTPRWARCGRRVPPDPGGPAPPPHPPT
ncbi:hypothetical protein GCM10022630_33770 [Thermobifida alba]